MRIGMTVVVVICLLMCPVSQSSGAEADRGGPPGRYDLADVTITLEHPGCGLSWCPSYVVSIHGDGRVAYEGRKNVANIGQREARIETERVLELLKHIYEVGFFSMSDSYTSSRTVDIFRGAVVESRNRLMDASSTTISVTIMEYQKRIEWIAQMAPQELLTIQPRIKEVSGVDRWIK